MNFFREAINILRDIAYAITGALNYKDFPKLVERVLKGFITVVFYGCNITDIQQPRPPPSKSPYFCLERR